MVLLFEVVTSRRRRRGVTARCSSGRGDGAQHDVVAQRLRLGVVAAPFFSGPERRRCSAACSRGWPSPGLLRLDEVDGEVQRDDAVLL
ncbi:MAG TPA: hypothetical protein VFP10_11965, partial [Candidatus Eisenbacteria bacterium]|nr:hypothetical protein [Candidatus Eisenbacteria bacterium]